VEFSKVNLSYSLFKNTNKITKIGNKITCSYTPKDKRNQGRPLKGTCQQVAQLLDSYMMMMMMIFFLAAQLQTKIKLSLNIRLRIMEYTAPLSLLKSATEAF
jgi:hypothetical protein